MVKDPPANAGDVKDTGSISGSGRYPGGGKWQPIPVFLPVESPWTEEPAGLESMGSQRVGHDWSKLAHTQGVYILYLMTQVVGEGRGRCKGAQGNRLHDFSYVLPHLALLTWEALKNWDSVILSNLPLSSQSNSPRGNIHTQSRQDLWGYFTTADVYTYTHWYLPRRNIYGSYSHACKMYLLSIWVVYKLSVL